MTTGQTTTHKTCIDCGIPLVPGGRPAPEGHAHHNSHGRCKTCASRHRRAQPRTVRLVGNCVECERPMRARHSAHVPGTVVHRSRGLCCGCADHLKNGSRRRDTVPDAVARPPVIPDLPQHDWTGAACAPILAAGERDLWFSDHERDQQEAILACRRCPVRAECLAVAMAAEGAVVAHGRYGIWGGLTPEQRYGLYRLAHRSGRE